MDKITTLKRILKYEILKMPIWCWLASAVLIFLLRHLIKEIMLFVFPAFIGLAFYYNATGQPRKAAGVGVLIAFTALMVAFC